MRISTLLTGALPLLVSAQEQVPLVDKVKSYVNDAVNQVQSKVFGTVDAAVRVGSAAISNAAVTELTLDTWKDTLRHSGKASPGDPPEAWMVYVTAGNKTCHGHCERVDRAWDEAVTQLVADPTAPHLAVLDCERQEVLCGAWAAELASIWFFLVPHPAPDQSRAATPLTIHKLNMTTVTNADITRIHTQKTYLQEPQYEGMLHPFDGSLQRFGLQLPMAYFLWGMAKIPSWAFMIGLSFFSRSFMSRRMPQERPAAAAAARPAAR